MIKNLTRTGDSNHPYYCDSKDCHEGIYNGPNCSPTNMYTCATLLSSYPGNTIVALSADGSAQDFGPYSIGLTLSFMNIHAGLHPLLFTNNYINKLSCLYIEQRNYCNVH